MPDDEVGRLARTFDDMIARLDEAFRRQRQFTADASHELRTPLTAIKGQTEVALQRDRDPEEYRDVLRTVNSEVDRMTRLVGSLLTMARADARQIPMNKQEVALGELVADAVEQVRPAANEKGISITLQGPDDTHLTADQDLLLQLVLNLLDNAVKYTPSGGVITVSWRQDRSDAVVEVSDNGPGIAAEHLPHVFDRFYRVDAARTRAEGGSGLGLSICQWIAEAHGGSIACDSALGAGSTFTASACRLLTRTGSRGGILAARAFSPLHPSFIPASYRVRINARNDSARSLSMRYMVLTLAATLTLAILGCGDDDEKSDASTATPSSATINPSDFSATVDNTFFPLTSTQTMVYEGEETDPDTGEKLTVRVESTVQGETDTVDGVEVTVVKEDDYEDGELVESTLDYYAQHSDGTVYYMGERVDDYENGEVVDHHGQWLAGEGSNQGGEFMPADPQVGDEFEQEKAPGIAEDQSKIVAVDETVTVPAGAFTGCIKTEDYDPIGDVTEFKYYCPDVGLVAEESEEGDRLELISY